MTRTRHSRSICRSEGGGKTRAHFIAPISPRMPDSPPHGTCSPSNIWTENVGAKSTSIAMARTNFRQLWCACPPRVDLGAMRNSVESDQPYGGPMATRFLTRRRNALLSRLLAAGIALFLALLAFAADWVIVRRDGGTIECDGPYLVIDGDYVFRDREGKSRTLPAAEVDASLTAAANTERTAAATVSAGITGPNGIASASPAKTGDFLSTFNGSFPPPPIRSRHVDYQLKPS